MVAAGWSFVRLRSGHNEGTNPRATSCFRWTKLLERRMKVVEPESTRSCALF